MQPPVHRHARSRNQMMEGLVLQGMNSAFGKIAVGMLLLLGMYLVVTKKKLAVDQLHKFTVHVLNKPYQPGMGNKKKDMVVIPVAEGKKLLRVQYLSLAAAPMAMIIENINPGDSLEVWMDEKNASLFAASGSGGMAEVLLINKNSTPIISVDAYNKVMGVSGSVGWGILLLAASMIPYFFISRPKFSPVYTFLLVLAGLIAWFLLF
jgi:hypothetical protein